MISVTSTGSFTNTERFLKALSSGDIFKRLEPLAMDGANALAKATPNDTGKTANSWGYEVSQGVGGFTITWTNNNIHEGANIALLIQYGHGTGTGGYINGIDYINPAIKPIFDRIAEQAWKAVTLA